jgi:hypothetical protein
MIAAAMAPATRLLRPPLFGSRHQTLVRRDILPRVAPCVWWSA